VTFEYLIADILNARFNTTSFQLNGKNGQSQSGIDIISTEHSVIVQCKLITTIFKNKSEKERFIKKILNDVISILNTNFCPKKIIIATTLSDDTLIAQEINNYISYNDNVFVLELWTWNHIINMILAYPHLFTKYYPFYLKTIEIAHIDVLNRKVYQKSESIENLYDYNNIKRLNHLPVFDITFINQGDLMVTLHSIDIYWKPSAAMAGFPLKPLGPVNLYKKYKIHINTHLEELDGFAKSTLFLKDPIYIDSRIAFRLQLQGDKILSAPAMIWLVLNFNNVSLRSQILRFNSTYPGFLKVRHIKPLIEE
jgi:hypothetical protein